MSKRRATIVFTGDYVKSDDTMIDSLRSRIDDLVPEAVERLEGLVNINTFASNADGLSEAISLLEKEMARAGMNVARLPGGECEFSGEDGLRPGKTGEHLLGRVGKGRSARILLSGHYDTVYPPASGFLRFERLSEDTALGPGVTDMKGGLFVMLLAVRALNDCELLKGLSLEMLVTSDEEIGSPASRHIIEEHASKNDAVLVYESCPDEDTFVSRRKGTAQAVVTAHGRAAHAGCRPEDGVNAIEVLADFISRACGVPDNSRGTTLNADIIHGGTVRNQIPDFAYTEYDIRYVEENEARHLEDEMARLAKLPLDPDAKIEVNFKKSRPPKPGFPALEKFIGTTYAELFGKTLRWKSSGGGTDGSFTGALKIPTVDTLGVRGSGIHTHDETVHLSSLASQALLSAVLLYRAGRGELP